MNTVVDEVLNTSATGNKIKFTITPDGGTPYTATIELATPVSTTGTPINKQLFDSIQADITSLNNNKLNVSAKASQSEAEAGTNDTKYMTPLKVKQELAVNKITRTQFAKWTTSTYTLDIANYITTDTLKLEIMLDCRFESTFKTLLLNGTKFHQYSGLANTLDTYTSTFNITNENAYIEQATIKLEIFPNEKRIYISGTTKSRNSSSSGTSTHSTGPVYEQVGYETLTTLTMGKLDDSTNPVYNSDFPISIIEYKK